MLFIPGLGIICVRGNWPNMSLNLAHCVIDDFHSLLTNSTFIISLLFSLLRAQQQCAYISDCRPLWHLRTFTVIVYIKANTISNLIVNFCLRFAVPHEPPSDGGSLLMLAAVDIELTLRFYVISTLCCPWGAGVEGHL